MTSSATALTWPVLCWCTQYSSLSVTRTSVKGRFSLTFLAMSIRCPTPTSTIFLARGYFSLMNCTSWSNIRLCFGLLGPAWLEDGWVFVVLPHLPHAFHYQLLFDPRYQLFSLDHLVGIDTHTDNTLSYEELYDFWIVGGCLSADGCGDAFFAADSDNMAHGSEDCEVSLVVDLLYRCIVPVNS